MVILLRNFLLILYRNMLMRYLYQEIELLFSALINSLEDVFTELEILEVKEFLDYGEYGIALETLAGIILEGDNMISKGTFYSIEKLSSLMRVDNTAIISELRVKVI